MSSNASSSRDGSSPSAASSSSSSSLESSLQTLDVGETCSYYARNRMSGCRWPRTCQSCLGISGCMINTAGWCVSLQQEAFDPDKDFQIGIDEGYALPNATANASLLALTQEWQFRAGKVKYCTTDDATCQRCVRQNFWRGRSSYPDSHFCVGTDGCVCVDVCERRWYVRNDCPVVATPSPTPSVTATSSYYITNSNIADRIWRGMVGVIIFTLLFLLIVIRQRKKAEARERAQRDERLRRQEARRQRRHNRAESLGVNPLNLSGWETYRRDLIDKEKRHLSGEGDEVTRTTEGSESSGDESSDDDEIRSPRAHGETSASAVYVRMEEMPTPSAPSAPPVPAATMAHGAVAPTAQRDALPSLQVSAPVQRR